MKVTIFGIPNCGSVKKARIFFEDKAIPYEFHDYKKLEIDEKHLEKWCTEFGWEKVLNKKGQTWRGLDETLKNKVNTQADAIKVMLEYTSAIKRPVIESDKGNTIGFDEPVYEAMFG